jgi:hypothetical protein
MRYFDIQRHWRRVARHINDPDVQAVLVEHMNKFSFGQWLKPFKPGMLPEEFDCCDWRCHVRRQPAFWRYVCHGACHWMVSFNLKLAQGRIRIQRDAHFGENLCQPSKLERSAAVENGPGTFVLGESAVSGSDSVTLRNG